MSMLLARIGRSGTPLSGDANSLTLDGIDILSLDGDPLNALTL